MLHCISRVLLVVAFVLVGRLHVARAWWDEPHMILAAVARLQLTEEEIKLLEYPLQFFESEYPGLDTIVTSAIWPDHLKCTHSSDICFGSPSVDGMQIFDTWHYVDNVYNPQNFTLSPSDAQIPFPETGAVWALNQLIGHSIKVKLDKASPRTARSLIRNGWNYVDDPIYSPGGGHDEYPVLPEGRRPAPSPEVDDDEDILVPQTARRRLGSHHHHHHHKHSDDNDGERPVLSRFTWNMRLRFLIHIFGDLHQPLHATSLFSKQYPRGDKGGNDIKIKVHLDYPVSNLHKLWDACGGLYVGVWPDKTEEDAMTEAKKLVKRYTPEELHPDSVTTFQDVAMESFDVAKAEVYKEFDFENGGDHAIPEPYHPSDKYIENVKEVCRRRVTLGGYRLATILKDLAEIIRHGQWIEMPATPQNLNLVATASANVTSPSPASSGANQILLSWAPLLAAVSFFFLA